MISLVRVGQRRGMVAMDECDISSIAVCAGSGTNFLLKIIRLSLSGGSVFAGVKADLFLTGEMGHHQVLELCDRNGAHVVLTEHSNCERGYLQDIYIPTLKKEIGDSETEVIFSQVDTDPLKVI